VRCATKRTRFTGQFALLLQTHLQLEKRTDFPAIECCNPRASTSLLHSVPNCNPCPSWIDSSSNICQRARSPRPPAQHGKRFPAVLPARRRRPGVSYLSILTHKNHYRWIGHVDQPGPGAHGCPGPLLVNGRHPHSLADVRRLISNH